MKKEILIVIIALIIVLVGAWLLNKPAGPGQYDAFAACIKNSGATFYGAFWCPHCKAQKEEFGSSASLLPYVECSTPDGQSQTPICQQKGIQSYPTWYFANGTNEEGTLSFEELSKQTNCPLPGSIATSTDIGGTSSVSSTTKQ